ncbi:hypothetical protein [uncultured Dokdonia sp.]|uniref:coiled-coil domain-containing protein n=1 Tax=uncultured Dokdonia sp. TaxID=575653 RepID=UPI002624E787|nr:hypothetical protein [uncultured Dokdonia sp.]
MGTKSTKNTLLILTILLCVVVVSLGAYTIKVHGEMQENESRLKEEKALIAEELKEEIKKYNDILTEKNILSNELSDAKESLEALQKRLDSNEITQSIVRAYRIELNKMRRERELLFKQNDSLLNETERLAKLQAETQDALEKATKAQSTLENDKRVLEEKLSLGAQITANNLIVRGVIQRNSGKFLNTSRANRAKMVRICYEINENKLAKPGDLQFFVQVFNSDGKMIGIPREEKLSNGKNILFNSRTTIPYRNKPFNVCELVLPVQTFEKGIYTVNVLHEDRLLLTSELELK